MNMSHRWPNDYKTLLLEDIGCEEKGIFCRDKNDKTFKQISDLLFLTRAYPVDGQRL